MYDYDSMTIRSATIEIFARLQRQNGRRFKEDGSATIEIFARLQPLSQNLANRNSSATIEIFARLQLY